MTPTCYPPARFNLYNSTHLNQHTLAAVGGAFASTNTAAAHTLRRRPKDAEAGVGCRWWLLSSSSCAGVRSVGRGWTMKETETKSGDRISVLLLVLLLQRLLYWRIDWKGPPNGTRISSFRCCQKMNCCCTHEETDTDTHIHHPDYWIITDGRSSFTAGVLSPSTTAGMSGPGIIHLLQNTHNTTTV